MKYKKSIINQIDIKPIGIWQDKYFFLEAAYTITLKNKVLKIESNSAKPNSTAKSYDFDRPLGQIIKKVVEETGIENPILFGFISYDYANNLEKIRGFETENRYPELYFIIPKTYLLKLDDGYELYDLDGDFSETKSKDKVVNEEKNSKIQWTKSKDEFSSLTKKAKNYIAEGDIFQIVLSNKLVLENKIDPLKLYHSLLSRNPSAYHFLVRFGENSLVGASPETMLNYNPKSRNMLMRLIAGTYPRLESKYKYEPEEFLKDEKELAEHMMLVDHCRNDLGKVAEIGSVKVSDLLKVESLNDVYHLVSQVEATLKKDLNHFDALDSCFPIATLTGTPKIRAMEIISELENQPRGLFGGAVGLFNCNGSADLAVIIRSAIVTPDKCEVSAGAGIVADSIPEREFEECLWKAEALKEILTK